MNFEQLASQSILVMLAIGCIVGAVIVVVEKVQRWKLRFKRNVIESVNADMERKLPENIPELGWKRPEKVFRRWE